MLTSTLPLGPEIGDTRGLFTVLDNTGLLDEGGTAYRVRCSCGLQLILSSQTLSSRRWCGYFQNHDGRQPRLPGYTARRGDGPTPGMRAFPLDGPTRERLAGILTLASARTLQGRFGLCADTLTRAVQGYPVSDRVTRAIADRLDAFTDADARALGAVRRKNGIGAAPLTPEERQRLTAVSIPALARATGVCDATVKKARRGARVSLFTRRLLLTAVERLEAGTTSRLVSAGRAQRGRLAGRRGEDLPETFGGAGGEG